MRMWEAWNRRLEGRRLEARLRSARPIPRDAFVHSLASRVSPRPAVRAWSRLAFAGALTTLLLGMFASFGGIGYAASGATHAVRTLTKLTTTQSVRVHSSAAAQYAKPPTTPTTQVVAAAAANQGVASANAVKAETLPFTGFSLLATVLVSIVLMGIGLALRRREGRDS